MPRVFDVRSEILRTTLLGAFAVFTADGLAADEVKVNSEFIPAVTKQTDRVKILGWDAFLKAGATGNIGDNSHVVGKDDGQTTTLGLKIDSALDYKEVDREWLNTLNLFASTARTPLIPRYVKVDDALDFESLFKYYFSDSFGAFSRLNFDTPMFDGYDNRTDVSQYTITRIDGSTTSVTDDRLKLTDGLRPFKLRESIGLFANLSSQEIFQWDVKGGLGLRQVYADKQYVLDDNSATVPIEVKEIRNSSKAGYELGTDVSGDTKDKRFTYRFSFNVLFPFYERPEDGSTGDDQFEKRVIDIAGQLSYHIVEWVSFDYVLKVLRDPSILQRSQVSQSYLFSLNKVFAEREE